MNAHFKTILYIIVINFILTSCEQSNKIDYQVAYSPQRISEEAMPLYDETDEMVLGNQRQNPYDIDNMRAAYYLLEDYRDNFSIGDVIPYVNMIYYRVLPSDSSEAAILAADTSVTYFDYPLDYDIERWGSYYHDPSVNTNFTWLYAVVPANHPLPNLSSLEILQECYLPEEPIDSGHEAVPDWKNGYAMLEYMAYRESGNADMYDPEDVAMYEEILLITANRSSENGEIAPRENTRSLIWDFICGVHPAGTFRVDNTYTEDSEGIKNVNVIIHNFIKFYCGPVNANGRYYSTKCFRTRSFYHIRFHNHLTQTNIYGGLKFLIGPVHRHLGLHSKYGYNCTLRFDDVAWRYASINNAIVTYFNYCQEYNILFPYDMRVWVCGLGNGNWGGSTPLFHKRNVPIDEMIFHIAFPFVGPLSAIVFFFDIPDMALFVSQGDANYDTLAIYELVFHEFGHASHYEKVGNTYWMLYVLHIVNNQGYGANASGLWHGYCGIGEMWGNFVGSYFLYKYMGYSYPYIYLTSAGTFNYSAYHPAIPWRLRFIPDRFWFHPGILAKIHEDSYCSIFDIYNALNADVYSLQSLKTSLQNQGIDENIIINAYDTLGYWQD